MARRLFSIFENANESVLQQQCQDGLAAWGCDSFQSRTFAADILQKAKATITAESDVPAGVGESACLKHMDTPFGPPDAMGNGVTAADAQWYWSLPPLARAVMHGFDGVLRCYTHLLCHSVNLCIEDLEQDVRQRLPTFGKESVGGEDAPLPWELRRRFVRFVEQTRANEQAWREWGERCRQASSMNAAIREQIRAGRL
jgi:hypothetical protein